MIEHSPKILTSEEKATTIKKKKERKEKANRDVVKER